MTPAEFGLKAAKALEDKILELGADKVAAFIGEPIQGAGGVIIPPETYWPEIQRICRKYDVLLVADEVICGFGRTGHWFAGGLLRDQAGLHDAGQGHHLRLLPLSAVMVGDRVAKVLFDKAASSATATPIPAIRSPAPWRWRTSASSARRSMVERVHDETGPYLDKRLQELRDHPLVGEVRSLGFIGAIELVKDKAKRKTFEPVGKVGTICRDHCFRNGLIMRATRDTMLISPPLIWTKGAYRRVHRPCVKKSLDLTLKDSKSW